MERGKRIIFTGLLTILFLPFLQLCLNVISSAGLYGDYTNAPDVEFSWAKWWDGSYQQGKAAYVNDQGGFRRDLVRCNNQVDYWLFDKLHCQSVVMGKRHCLFQPDYINAYYGRDFVGQDSARHIFLRLRAIQDTLAKLGKTLLVVHPPCKAFFYPTEFPDELESGKKALTNFSTYVHLADSLQVNQIDFNTWFVRMKDTCKELLYPRQGIHWSVYGAQLACDSLTRRMEQLRHIRMPHIATTGLRRTDKAEDTDDDVYKALNLFMPIEREIFTYPVLQYREDKSCTRPKVIYIGDSFGINWIHNGYMNFSNTGWEFWFYFHQVLNKENKDNPDSWKQIDAYDWRARVNESDCIIIMYTSHNLHQLGNGFIQKLYDTYFPGGQ